MKIYEYYLMLSDRVISTSIPANETMQDIFNGN